MNGVVVWITGLPSSGKSTLARLLCERLRAAGRTCALLDGDEVRAALVPAPGYDTPSRHAFYATLGRLAALVDVPADTCARRDLKGLWRAARSGTLVGLPGADVLFEPPLRPEVTARGGLDERALGELVRWIDDRGRAVTAG